jgi:V/A-type H+-transporting ATPase subunit I
MLIWGNYFTALNLVVYPGNEWPITLMLVLYVGGLFLTALFSINWKDIGDVCNYPFGLIGTFVDLLSYIRLFAVGLATYYVADSFNNMGVMLMKTSDNMWAVPFLVLAAVIVILAGHGLNIILAGLAILVHGIRLNTLEFSNHMSLQWLGHVYAPFKKREKSDI